MKNGVLTEVSSMEETTGSCNAVAPFDSGEVVAVRAAESITKGNGETSLLSRTEKKKTGSEHARIGQQLLTSPRRRSRRRRRPRAAVVLRRGSRATGGAAAAQHPFPLEASPAQAFSLSALLCSSLSPLMRIEEAIQSSNCGGTRKAGAVGSEAFDTWG